MKYAKFFSLLTGFTLLASACAPQDYAPTPTPNPPQTPTLRPRLLQAGELQLAADIDDIPAIFASDDLFITAQLGNQEWPPDELVIGLVIGGDARAYPVRLLNLHEIVNDVVGGQQIAVTWCPLCYSALVFNRVIDGRELTFGVSGYLYRNNLVMYDHQTNTLWSQLLGQSLRGAFRRRYLELLPSVLAPWGEWQKMYPNTRILSAEKMGQNPNAIFDPYAGYYTSAFPGITGVEQADTRLKPKDLIIGIQAGKYVRAYSLETLRRASLINDQLGATPLLLVYDADLGTALVYQRELDGQQLSFKWDAQTNYLQDEQTASLWNPQTASAIKGPLTGKQLSRLISPLVFWFAWADIHPDTELYQP